MKGHFNQKSQASNIRDRGLVLIDFCASWSSPCNTQWAILQDLSKKLRGTIEIVRINIDDPDNESDKYKINAVPTLCLLKEGKEIKRFIGVQQLDTLLHAIETNIE